MIHPPTTNIATLTANRIRTRPAVIVPRQHQPAHAYDHGWPPSSRFAIAAIPRNAIIANIARSSMNVSGDSEPINSSRVQIMNKPRRIRSNRVMVY
jgi:hypothetical protein